MVDRCRSLKLEAPYEGGSQLDTYPCDINPNQDGLDARAHFVQSDTSSDATAYVSRTGADLTFTDGNAGTKNLQDLVSRVPGAVASHASLPDMAHFLGAPADGWSAPFFSVTYLGPLVTQRAWYTSSGMTQFIFRQVYTYNGPFIASVVSTAYGSTGAVLKTVTDVYAYSGPLLASISRSSS